ncbi:MAG TPA: hypothetical protein VGN17_06040 [Bryobacteraceae bacterium]|jgi:hypothetical protein
MQTDSQKKATEKLLGLVQAEFPGLSDAEQELIRQAVTTETACAGPHDPNDAANYPEFSEVDTPEHGAPWEKKREVRAGLIRWLCVNAEAAALVDPNGIQLFGARITGILKLDFVTIPFPLRLRRCRLTALTSLLGCQIPRLDLEGSWTEAIAADGAVVKQSVFLSQGFQANGTVSLVTCQIGGSLVCEGGRFLETIVADGLSVGGDALLRSYQVGKNATGFLVQRGLRLIGAKIEGDLDCRGGTFGEPRDPAKPVNPPPDAINLERAEIKGPIVFLSDTDGPATVGFQANGKIDLAGASAGILADERGSWPEPGCLRLDGFVYERIDTDSPRDAAARLDWLARDTAAPQPTQPYRHLAKLLQDSGDSRGARKVLMAMEERLAKQNNWPPMRWLKWFIGYGYWPIRAVWVLLAVWLLGGLASWQGAQVGAMAPTDKDTYVMFKSAAHRLPPHYPAFSPPAFSFENTFPLVKLGQADKWPPDPAPDASAYAVFLRRAIWVQIVLGWFLATLFVAGVSGIVQHD